MQPKKINLIDDFKTFINDIFFEAISKKASDIHVEPQKELVLIRYRIDGEIYSFYEVENTNKNNLLTRFKVLAQLKIDESRLPQDGQIVFPYEWEDIDMRVSSFPTLHGEKIVVRILQKDPKLLNINSLAFMQLNLNLIKKSLKLKEWLIVVSWPTGSGKTTTLYAMLNHFHPESYNISTLEDPIEYRIIWINQSQVNSEIGYTFSKWLRTLLRQDPDIILVWEIRDKETALLAIEAALTWHLVFGTIHANKGMWVVERFINMWIEPYLLSSALKLIVSQRLAKKLCKCSKKVDINQEQEKIFQDWLAETRWSIKDSVSYKESVWCEECMNIWYSWRLWIHEVIVLDSDFNKLMFWNLEKDKWEEEMARKGYLSLYQDGLLKSAFWLTTLDQILPYKDK